MRKFLIIVIAASVVTLIGWAYFRSTSSWSHVPPGPAVSVTVFDDANKSLGTITNTAALAKVTKVLRSGRQVELHLCTPAGHIDVRFASGETLSGGLGPGHDESRYEFGMDNQLFSVSRDRFLEALKSGGIDVAKMRTE